MVGTYGNRPDAAARLLRVDKDLYSPEEIAELFDNVTVEMVQNAVWEHKLPAVIENHSIIGIHRADFLTWITKGKD